MSIYSVTPSLGATEWGRWEHLTPRRASERGRENQARRTRVQSRRLSELRCYFTLLWVMLLRRGRLTWFLTERLLLSSRELGLEANISLHLLLGYEWLGEALATGPPPGNKRQDSLGRGLCCPYSLPPSARPILMGTHRGTKTGWSLLKKWWPFPRRNSAHPPESQVHHTPYLAGPAQPAAWAGAGPRHQKRCRGWGQSAWAGCAPGARGRGQIRS